MPNDPVFIDNQGRIPGSGGGSGVDELVKVSDDDTTADYLANKVAAGTGVTLTVLNDGANEQLRITTDSVVTADDEDIIIPFAFDDTSPIAITTLSLTATISKIRTIVDVVFDDASATLSVGVPGNDSVLQMTTENDLTSIGSYETWPELELSTAVDLEITLTPATSAQGSGRVVVTLSR